MAYRVDNIPFWLKPLFLLYSYSLGFFLYVFFILFFRATLKIEFEGKENLEKGPFIYCIWHEDLSSFFLVFKKLQSSQIWLNHPLWYMKPVHVLLWFLGIKRLVLGSTGNQGKEGAQKLEALLKDEKVSTTFAVDGPKGPPKIIKKGALYASLNTGFPLMPLRFVVGPSFRIKKTWDQKKCALPFGRIKVLCSKPLYVNKENFDEAYDELENLLNEKEI